MLELNWQQNFIKDKLTVIVGKVDPTNYFNFLHNKSDTCTNDTNYSYNKGNNSVIN